MNKPEFNEINVESDFLLHNNVQFFEQDENQGVHLKFL